MDEPRFKEKFVGFVDVLGFKSMIEAAEAGTGMSLPKVLELFKELGKPDDRERLVAHGPHVCPMSTYLERDLDFQVTQVSDCVVASAEVSPAGVVNLVEHCWRAALMLMTKGVLVRGYVARGLIYHEGSTFVGSGYHQAYSKERDVTAFKRRADEKGTPFIEVDRAVCDYVKDHGDDCVKEMFSRFVSDDGNVVAIFPFKRLYHRFAIAAHGPPFDPEKEKRSNQNLRKMIEYYKKRIGELVDASNPSAVSKAEHYVEALDAQLSVCDKTDAVVDKLSSRPPRRSLW